MSALDLSFDLLKLPLCEVSRDLKSDKPVFEVLQFFCLKSIASFVLKEHIVKLCLSECGVVPFEMRITLFAVHLVASTVLLDVFTAAWTRLGVLQDPCLG